MSLPVHGGDIWWARWHTSDRRYQHNNPGGVDITQWWQCLNVLYLLCQGKYICPYQSMVVTFDEPDGIHQIDATNTTIQVVWTSPSDDSVSMFSIYYAKVSIYVPTSPHYDIWWARWHTSDRRYQHNNPGGVDFTQWWQCLHVLYLLCQV